MEYLKYLYNWYKIYGMKLWVLTFTLSGKQRVYSPLEFYANRRLRAEFLKEVKLAKKDASRVKTSLPRIKHGTEVLKAAGYFKNN